MHFPIQRHGNNGLHPALDLVSHGNSELERAEPWPLLPITIRLRSHWELLCASMRSSAFSKLLLEQISVRCWHFLFDRSLLPHSVEHPMFLECCLNCLSLVDIP